MDAATIDVEPTYHPHPNEASRFKQFVYQVPIPDSSDPEVFDPRCDPENPIAITRQEVIEAHDRIKAGVLHTPCKLSRGLSQEFGMQIYLKEDFRQITGSFKERGCRNAILLLDEEQRKNGVIAASAGNHALGMAYNGRELGVEVTVVMPITAPMIKIENCIKLGARVIINGKTMNETKNYALKLAHLNQLRYINGFDDTAILAGQGTMGIEILQDVPDVDAVIVPIGGGGLLAGISTAMADRLGSARKVAVYGVESVRAQGWTGALKAGKPVFVQCHSTIADGLSVQVVGVNSFESCKGKVDGVFTVDERYIAMAILRLLESEKAVVEGAGATAMAAIFARTIPGLKGKKVVVLCCGGNIDAIVLCRVIERGLAHSGRLHQFTLILPDKIGSIANLSALLSSKEASIQDIYHERAWLASEIYMVQVKCVIETKNNEHAERVREALEERYQKIIWGPPESKIFSTIV